MRLFQKIINIIINPIVGLSNNKVTNVVVNKCNRSPWIILVVSLAVTGLIMLLFYINAINGDI